VIPSDCDRQYWSNGIYKAYSENGILGPTGRIGPTGIIGPTGYTEIRVIRVRRVIRVLRVLLDLLDIRVLPGTRETRGHGQDRQDTR
jgi:hypothetical protein